MVSPARTIRTVIADDEPAARAKLQRLLAAHPDVAVVAEAATGVAVIDAVRRERPDLLLLDIRMPEIDGLSALGTFGDELRPLVVFVTAYDDYAVRAFAERALDYLLKPFDAARLAAALVRVRERLELQQRPSAAAVRDLLARARQAGVEEATMPANETGAEYLRRIAVRSGGKVEMVQVPDIEWVEAAGNYVRLHTATSRPLLRETMRHLAERLDPARFVRIHRGALVNLDAVARMEPLVSGDYLVRLRSGARLRMSRSFRAEVERRLQR